jgi:hypothetical protein
MSGCWRSQARPAAMSSAKRGIEVKASSSLRPWQRAVVIISGLAIAFLVIAGYPLLADRITPLGWIALIAAFVLLIWWVIRDSRRL